MFIFTNHIIILYFFDMIMFTNHIIFSFFKFSFPFNRLNTSNRESRPSVFYLQSVCKRAFHAHLRLLNVKGPVSCLTNLAFPYPALSKEREYSDKLRTHVQRVLTEHAKGRLSFGSTPSMKSAKPEPFLVDALHLRFFQEVNFLWCFVLMFVYIEEVGYFGTSPYRGRA